MRYFPELFLFCVLTWLLLLAPTPGISGSGLPGAPHVIVNGEASLQVSPDRLTMSLSIVDAGTDTAAVRASVEKRSRMLIDSLLELGLEEKDITATQLRIVPHFNWSGQQQIYTGTEVLREINLTLKDLDRYDKMMAAVTTAGISRINNTRLSVSNREEVEEKLLRQAIANARHQAGILARETGRKLGPVYSIVPQGEGGPILRERYTAVKSLSSGASGFEPGQLTLQNRIRLVFLLE